MIADLRPYPRYRDSALSWLGSLPDDWKIRRAKFLFREVDQRSETGKEELLSVSHLTGVTPRSQKTITMFLAKSNVGHKVCRPGDLVINTMWAWMGALGVAKHSGLVSPAYGVYRPLPSCDILPRYADYLLRTPVYVAEYQRRSTGVNSSRLRLYSESFLGIEVVIPPQKEQSDIVRFLDWANGRLERAVRAKRKVIALLNERKQAVIDCAVTRGLERSVPLKPSGIHWLGDIPHHWELVRSGSMFRLFGGYAFPGTGFFRDESQVTLPLLLTPVNFDLSGGLRFGSKSVRFRGNVPVQFELRKGDLVTVLTDLSSKRLILGRAGFIERDGVLLNQRTARVEIQANVRDRLRAEYLYWVLNSNAVREQTIATSRGSTVFHTSPRRMLAAHWPLPPFQEQIAIIEKLKTVESENRTACETLRDEIEYLLEYRTRLISDAVTGELDVRAAAARLPEAAESEITDTDEAELDSEEADEEVLA